ncbi:RloB family protein [Kribbella qitaiheensis]|uniref:RloB family protein n=1 Tax=Kribbella qitaiheensis TaxID=1544730 RepID=UPI00248410F2|nr:RloB family protein [Kribbella qitaiheensis]
MFCEGEASEPDYINAVKRLPQVQRNVAVNIEIDPERGVPLTLVERAVARLKSDAEIDECWCVFDVEWPRHHPNLDRALRMAKTNGIKLAISTPCFELWLILHFQDQTAFLDNRTAESLSRRLEGRTGKRIDGSKYLPLRRDASKRAAALVDRHRRDQTVFPNDNPSSTMHELLATIEPSS